MPAFARPLGVALLTAAALAVPVPTQILGYAQQHHLARLTFWSTNRDRPCTGGPADSCSGIAQQNWDFTRIFAAYTG
jgi:hypothetical protein